MPLPLLAFLWAALGMGAAAWLHHQYRSLPARATLWAVAVPVWAMLTGAALYFHAGGPVEGVATLLGIGAGWFVAMRLDSADR